MLRYIIGISIITIVLMIIRYLSNGRILKKHQYAMWLIIPVCMLLFPFLRISIPVPEELVPYIPVREETAVTGLTDFAGYADIEKTEQNDTAVIEDEHLIYQNDLVENEMIQADQVNVDAVLTEESSVKRISVDWYAVLTNISITVSVIMIILLAIYNAGFILYCRRNRKYLGKDPISGLKIFVIDHNSAPFLLFDGIYVDKDFEMPGSYRADKEIYVDNISGRMSSYIICHEACHHKHGDYIWVIVRYLVLAVNWYNPIIWTAFILSGRDCELACDEEVLLCSESNSSVGYAESLLELLNQRAAKSFGFTVTTGMRGGFEVMKKRIISITNPAKKSYKTFVVGLVALIIVSGCFVIEPMAAVNEPLEEIPDVIAVDEDMQDFPESADYSMSLYNSHDVYFYRHGIAIKGILMLPLGEGPFKTIVMCGSYDSSYYIDIASRFNDKGYAVVIFDFSNALEAGQEPDGDFLHEEVMDLNAVIDGLKNLPDVDCSNIWLWGHSVGGFITAYAGVYRQNDIRGMILVEPYMPKTVNITHYTEAKVGINEYVDSAYLMLSNDLPSAFISGCDYDDIQNMILAYSSSNNGYLYIVDDVNSLSARDDADMIADRSLKFLKNHF